MDTSTKLTIEIYFNAAIFAALMQGIHFVVSLVAISKIWLGFDIHRRQFRLGMTVIMTLIFVLTTADLAVYWAYVRHAFIVQGDSPNSIVAALVEYPTWFLATNVFEAASVFIADCISIWRTFIIWERQWKIIILPIAFTIFATGMSIAELAEALSRSTKINSFLTAFWSLTLVTPIFCTASIVYRLLDSGTMNSYTTIIKVLIESAALYCFATLFALITWVVPGPQSPFEYAFAFWKSCTGIAPTLIVACIDRSGNKPMPFVTESDREGQCSSSSISSAGICVHTETRIYADQGSSRDSGKVDSLN